MSSIKPTPLYIAGLAGLERPEQQTVRFASSFFVSYVSLADTADAVSTVVSDKGGSLVQYLLQAIAGAAPRSHLPFFSEVLGALCAHCASHLSHWLEVRVREGNQWENNQLGGEITGAVILDKEMVIRVGVAFRPCKQVYCSRSLCYYEE